MPAFNMPSKDTLRKYILLVLICSILGVSFFVYIHYSEVGQLPSLKRKFDKYLLSIALTNIIGLALLTADALLDKLIYWRNYFLIRFLAGFALNSALSISLMAGSVRLFDHINNEEFLKLSILYIISVFIYEIFYGWFYSYRYYAHTQVEQLRSERWQLELQFESLKNQISPHYLFNCLNTISSLLYKDSHTAEEFIRRMADTFRYVLSHQKRKLVTLREEIEFVKAYYYLLQVRYEDHLKLEINLPKSLMDTSMPPLTLQLLVENAVKHNQISKDNPLLVYISATDNTHIVITSTKTVAMNPSASFRIGLDNIKNRYQFFTDEKIIVKDESKFSVQLPVIKNQAPATEQSTLNPAPTMNRIFINSTIFRICSAPVFGVLIYLLILLINNTLGDINKLFSNQELYVCIGLSYILLESMRFVIRLIDRFQSRFSFQRRIIIQIILTLAVGLGLVAVAISSYFRWGVGFSISTHQLNIFLGIFAATSLLYNVLYFSQWYLLRENRLRIEQEKKMQEKVEADFLSFKNEINPDLLYESLENLILTLHHNADQAEEQIDYLAGIYRYSLVNRNKELVSLDEELRAAESLLSLLNYRHQKQLHLIATVPQANEIHLIPGSLLVTIDSVIRNTLISAKSPLVIRLYLEEDDDEYLVLQHTLNDKLQQHSESINAFMRLQRSYSFFSDKPFVQVKAGRENYIKFPLVRIAGEQSLSMTS